MVRFIMQNSVDQKLEAMGNLKEEHLRGVYGDSGVRLVELQIDDLIRLFEGEDGDEQFIFSDQPEDIA